jgi:hypothetical protein
MKSGTPIFLWKNAWNPSMSVVRRCIGLRRRTLIYKPVDRLIEELIQRKKYVYLCTNAMFLDKYWDRIPPHKRLCLSIHLDGLEQGTTGR